MKTLKDIKDIYLQPIPGKMKFEIEKYIKQDEVQYCIEKAMRCELKTEDYRTLGEIGNRNNCKYPYLYWLCCIYIHPLTIAQYIVTNIEKTK